MLSAQSVRHTRMPSYLQSDIPVLLIGPVASRRAVSICWKLRQRQLYDNPPASSLAFRQRRGIATRIEAMGFGGKPIRRSPLILEEILTTSPANDLAVPSLDQLIARHRAADKGLIETTAFIRASQRRTFSDMSTEREEDNYC